MKKIFFLAICILSFACARAQTFTSGHITVVRSDTMYHDSTTCASWCTVNYTITIDSAYLGDTVFIVDTAMHALAFGSPFVDTTGVSPWTFTASINSGGWGDYGVVGGYIHFYNNVTKVVCGLDTLRYIVNNDSLSVTNPCHYQNVTGLVYIDYHSDCTYDSGDVQVCPAPVAGTENLSSPTGFMYLDGWYSSMDGYYGLRVQQSWMVNYTVFLPGYYSFIFPPSPCDSSSYTLDTLPATVNFAVHCSSNIDVQCNALSPGSVRLHNPFFLQPYVSNTGCDTAAGTLTFIKDSRVIYDSALSTRPADTVRGDTLIWNYSGLTNLAGGAYWNSFFSDIYLTMDSTVVAGDTLCFSGYTNIMPADIDPTNNSFAFCMPVVYSYDPNLKTVSPKGDGPEGYIPGGHDTLTYNIHFQNTGSSYAQTVKVIDTLDSHILASSLRVLGASFNMTPSWLAPGVIQFSFDNIFLPDSGVNFAASQGALQFKVALDSGLAYGTQIKNNASIYFDMNPPVVTNTTLNTISYPTKIDPVLANSGIYVYPNPATDLLYVDGLNGGEISILNLNGEVITKQVIASDKASVDVSKLPVGLYILKATSAHSTATTMFTKL